jgi:hypothetical protein
MYVYKNGWILPPVLHRIVQNKFDIFLWKYYKIGNENHVVIRN